jgi:hypothetical protein
MTVSSTTVKNSYSGDGSTDTFVYGFKIFANTDLEVIIRSALGVETVKTLTTHYTVTGVGAASGGNVVFESGAIPTATETVVIRREVPQTQAIDYIANDPFPAESHEEGLDRATMTIQQMQEELDRSFKVSSTNSITTPEFTDDAATRASKTLGFDSTGQVLTTVADFLPAGGDSAMFQYSTTTTDADPGAGFFRLNNATIASATIGYFDDLEYNGTDISAWVQSWDDVAGNDTNRGRIRITKAQSLDTWMVFKVTGAVTDATGYTKVTLVYIDSAGTFTNNDKFWVAFSASGEDGAIPGYYYKFDTSTTDADPGAGDLRFNHATYASVTSIFIDDADANGGAASVDVLTWGASDSVIKGYIHIVDINDSSTYARFKVGAAVTDASGYNKITVAHLTSNNTFSAADELSVTFVRNGDFGDAATIEVGTVGVSTVGAGGSATATVANGGSTSEATFNFAFGIPTGATGADGDVTAAGVATLTNKTLTSPKINEDVVVTSTATELNLLDGKAATNLALIGKQAGTSFTNSLLIGHATTGTLSSANGNIGIGLAALDALTSGDNNIGIGYGAGTSINSGSLNTIIGAEAGNVPTTGIGNSFYGQKSGRLTSGSYNTLLGNLAGENLSSGDGNVIIGNDIDAASNTGDRQLVIAGNDNSTTTTWITGDSDGHVTVAGNIEAANFKQGGTNFTSSLLIGHSTTGTLDAANYNTIIGFDAGNEITSGDNNTLIGYNSGSELKANANNVGVGGYTLTNSSSGSSNTAIGYLSQKDGASGNFNSSIGYNSLEDASGNYNIGIGAQAGQNITTGAGNVIIGSVDADAVDSARTLKIAGNDGSTTTTWISGDSSANVTVGGNIHADNIKTEGTNFTGSLLVGHATSGTLSSADNNTGVGIAALDALTTGDSNTAVGNAAGTALTTGQFNTLVGGNSGLSLGTGCTHNVYLGNNSGLYNVTGLKNVAVGAQALTGASGQSNNFNTAIGHQAGFANTTGEYNIFLGQTAGNNITSGSGNVVIGVADVSSATADDQLSISDGEDGSVVWLTGDSNGQVKLVSGYVEEVALTDAATITWNAATQPVAKVTLGASRTMGLPANPVSGQFISLLIIQDGTGSRTITWNAAYEFAADEAPTLTATANLGDLFTFRYNGAKWLEVGRNLALTLS